jgi:hypothetical protein
MKMQEPYRQLTGRIPTKDGGWKTAAPWKNFSGGQAKRGQAGRF